MADADETFLRRWSRRKRAGGATPVVEAPAAAAPPPDGSESFAEVAGKTPPPRRADGGAPPARLDESAPETTAEATADLPDVDSLDKDSDYTAFLRKGVPEQLKRQALRKLWRSDPMFGHLDRLDDYDENFAAYFTETAAKVVKTAYKIGKGWVTDGDEATPAASDEATAADRGASREDAASEDAGDGGSEGAGDETEEDPNGKA